MKTVLGWSKTTGSRLVMDGEDTQFLEELGGVLGSANLRTPEEALLHRRVLARSASVLPELARDAKASEAVLDHAERIAASQGHWPASLCVAPDLDAAL